MNKPYNNIPIWFIKQFEIALETYSESDSGDFDNFFQVALDVLENKNNILKWTETRLKALDYKTPIEVIHQGNIDEVIEELVRLKDGVYI